MALTLHRRGKAASQAKARQAASRRPVKRQGLISALKFGESWRAAWPAGKKQLARSQKLAQSGKKQSKPK